MRILFRILLLLITTITIVYGIYNIFHKVDNINGLPPIPPVPDQKSYELKLYFGNSQNNGLVSEKRRIVTSEQNLEKIILEELIKGSKNKIYSPTIPSETEVISTETVNGVCYVNFSRNFLDMFRPNKMNGAVTIWSIVNSLTELEYIQAVQILVEGDKDIVLDKFYSFIDPLHRNEEILYKDTLTPFGSYKQFTVQLKEGNFRNAYEMLNNASMREMNFLNFKIVMGNYIKELREYKVYNHKIEHHDEGVILLVTYRKSRSFLSNIEDQFVERWKLVFEKGIWKISLSDQWKTL